MTPREITDRLAANIYFAEMDARRRPPLLWDMLPPAKQLWYFHEATRVLSPCRTPPPKEPHAASVPSAQPIAICSGWMMTNSKTYSGAFAANRWRSSAGSCSNGDGKRTATTPAPNSNDEATESETVPDLSTQGGGEERLRCRRTVF